MILKMKKAKLVVLKEEKDDLLKSLQRHSVLMIIPPEEITSRDNQVDPELARTEKSLNLINKYSEKKSFIRQVKNVNYEDFIRDDPARLEYLVNVEKTEAEIITLESESSFLKDEIKTYLPWQNLDIRLNDIKNTKHTVVHTGFIDLRKIESFNEIINKYNSVLKLYGTSEGSQAVMFINYYQDDSEMIDELKLLDYSEIVLPELDILVSKFLDEKNVLLKANNERIEILHNHLKELANDVSHLELLNDRIASKKELEKVEVTETVETAYIEGWIKADHEKLLRKAISDVTEFYDLEVVDPDEGENPPTVTKNNKFVSQFDTVTNMFARPGLGDVDPNPAMSVWFWIIFGMMMGDAVYGVLMIVAFFLLIKIKKPKGGALKLYKMLLYTGITTIIWGVIYGSYLGFTYKPTITPMDNVQEFLILSLVVGGLHIITGILLNAYKNIRSGDLVSALVDNLTWVLIISGIGLLVIPAISKVGLALIITGAVIILFFGGRSKKGIFGKLIGGLGGLYGVINYASDILSYSRVLALALSTAVIAMVMNLLAEMVLGIPYAGVVLYVLVLTVGHIFNIVMGLLSAFVHDSRLQYIEFFGKFYEGGGYEFTPLSYELKYIDKINDENIITNDKIKINLERN